MRVIIKASLTFIGFSHTVVALGAPLASTTVGLHHCMSDEQDHPMARMIGRTQCLFSQILSLIQRMGMTKPGPWLLRISVVRFSLMCIFQKYPKYPAHAIFTV